MNCKVAVIGMGQGGMVAAIKLARCGATVDIYEKMPANEVGYDWKDDIRTDIFSLVDLPLPDENIFCQKNKWKFISPSEEYSINVPPEKPMEEISIDRRGLVEYFAMLAVDAGCNIYYENNITKLYVRDTKVMGIVINDDVKYYDLIIDASGLNSCLRAQVPEKFNIQKKTGKDDVLYGYRAFFEMNENSAVITDDVKSSMIVKHLGQDGISWCNINEKNQVDVLIARIDALSQAEIHLVLEALREKFDFLSDRLLSEKRVEICLRCTMPLAVADGYVAIGDSAFMVMPLMGSGIESSMKAGNMFATFVKNNGIEDFTAENMWGFWVEYMQTIGKDFAFIDTLKRWALSEKLTPKDIDWVFSCGLITDSDLSMVTTKDVSENKAPSIGAKSILKKIFLLLSRFGLTVKIIGVLLRALKFKRVADSVPSKFDEKLIARWAEKYNDCIR